MKKTVMIIAALLLLLALFWFIGTGFLPQESVYLEDYSLLADGASLSLRVGVASSMGYCRSCRLKTDAEGNCIFKFYSAFGGLNGSWGVRNEFTLPLKEQCEKIYFYCGDGNALVLQKNPETGLWEKP